MSDLDETIKSLEWNKRLEKVRYGKVKSEEDEKYLVNRGPIEVLVAFLVGLLFGLIIGSIVVPALTGII
ncbi:MAG: hypothetical protein V5A88_08205 [Candidatus Thermoplasmatota archaeon]